MAALIYSVLGAFAGFLAMSLYASWLTCITFLWSIKYFTMDQQVSISKFLYALTLAVLGFSGPGSPVVAQVVKPNWSAPASTIVTAEERAFRNGDVHLSGTLYLPAGPKRQPPWLLRRNWTLLMRPRLHQMLRHTLVSWQNG